MEKFSAFRDPGTGLQPFLTPVPSSNPDLLVKVLLPFGYLLGTIRTVFVLLLAVIYVICVTGICTIFVPIPPIHRLITHAITAVTCRGVLWLVGLWWIPVEQTSRKRGRAASPSTPFQPAAGDIIVSNWVSWVEILWLAFRFNPIFVLPVTDKVDATAVLTPSTAITNTPGRRTGTGSANISTPSRTSVRKAVTGFREVSLLSMLRRTGYVPPYCDISSGSTYSLKDIRRKARRPIVIFPECTTSNGRGLLRFAEVFTGEVVPTKGFRVFVVCVRVDPPTHLKPSPALPIPSNILNPLPHLFSLTTSLLPMTISIRLLSPADSPGSPLFMVSEVLPATYSGNDQLSEVCSALIAQLGKMKRIGMGWEDKVAFLELYKTKTK